MHLTKAGMASLGRLISCHDAQLQEALDFLRLPRKYVYYISGAVGSGKTTVIQRLKSMSTLAEWTEARPKLLQEAHVELKEEQRRTLDKWISKQFRSKNFRLRESVDLIVVCDRTPLDPLAFTNPGELSSRAKEHLAIIQPDSDGAGLLSGHVILLTASPEELMARAKERHKGASLDYLRNQQAAFESLFNDADGAVTVLSTSSRTAASVVRAVSKIIHLGPYMKFDLAAKLKKLAEDENASL